VVKAVAAGANACMIGRAYLYGLGAGGQRGVERVLGWFRDDMRRTLALIGSSRVADLDPSQIDMPRVAARLGGEGARARSQS
jgi:L-lactate dehydrogenase (cytochrome)